MASEAVAIVMAAGKSTRMKSDLPKVLHDLCGQPLLSYVLAAVEDAGIRRKLVVVGFEADLVRRRFEGEPGVEFVLQAEQKGTGHAVQVCEDSLLDHHDPIVVLCGDGPMIRAEMISEMLERLTDTAAKSFLATAEVGDPFGLGRIVRDSDGNFEKIVEQKDITPQQARIREVNPSFYAFEAAALFETLREVQPNNQKGEYYLTDVPGIQRRQGKKVVAEVLASEADMYTINTRQHMAEAHALMQQRIQNRLMEAGVSIIDPRNTYIDSRAVIGRDTIIHPFTVIDGPAKIGSGCRIGPFAHLSGNIVLADGERIGSFRHLAEVK